VLRAVTLAAATAAPLASFTVPRIVAVSCPNAADAPTKSTTTKAPHLVKCLITLSALRVTMTTPQLRFNVRARTHNHPTIREF